MDEQALSSYLVKNNAYIFLRVLVSDSDSNHTNALAEFNDFCTQIFGENLPSSSKNGGHLKYLKYNMYSLFYKLIRLQ